jgi:hypothetical protein
MKMMDNIGSGFVTVTPSDTTNIPKKNGRFPSALRFGTGGAAVIVSIDDTVGTLTNIADGETVPVMCKRVNATGTTASSIVGIYIE